MIPLRGAAEIASRLEVAAAGRILLVEAPEELANAITASISPEQSLRTAEARTLRSVKEPFDLILLWLESRVGSRAVLDAAVKRLAPDGKLWVATALRKVTGPKTPAIHRLDLEDLKKAFEKPGLVADREARLSAWHVAHRFVAGKDPSS
jgi:uncharacterized protein (DUF885 family)